MVDLEKIGGTNSSFQSTQADITASQVASIEQAPYAMSELIGGEHVAGGGPGR
jgi:cell wall-associated NlpC family hydrolase